MNGQRERTKAEMIIAGRQPYPHTTTKLDPRLLYFMAGMRRALMLMAALLEEIIKHES